MILPLLLLAAVVTAEPGALRERQLDGTAPIANGHTFNATQCLDEKILDILESSNIPGASLAVLKRGKLAYEQGYGTLDAPGVGEDDHRPTLPSTPFRIASISKSITATVVLLLAQEGLLELDDIVFGESGVLHSFAQDYPPADSRIHNITIRQLLQHSAGFTPVLDPENPASDPVLSSRLVSESLGIPGPATCRDTMQFMMNVTLLYAPGTDSAYSNFGYCVLGRVIEAVTNMTYEEATWQWLLDVAGVDREEMYLGAVRIQDIPSKEAEYFPSPDYAPGVCPGPSLYPKDEGQNVTCPYGSLFVKEVGDSLGGWVASARQLVKVVAAISPPHCKENDCLLSEPWRDELEALPSFYPSNSTYWYGLGWYVHQVENGLTWSHTGGIPGTFSFLTRMDEEDGYAYAIIFNADNITFVPFNDSNVEQGIRVLLSDMAKCVDDDEWPLEYYESMTSSGATLVSWSASIAIWIMSIVMAWNE